MKKAHQDVFMKIFQPIQSKLTATKHYYSILIKPKVLKNGKSLKKTQYSLTDHLPKIPLRSTF